MPVLIAAVRRSVRRVKQAPAGFELELWGRGLVWVAGLDEAGRGCWAGPVTAGAVILPATGNFSGLDDSKILTARERDDSFQRLQDGVAVSCAAGMADAAEIDALGIVPATRLAMRRALAGLSVAPEHLLIDALNLPEIALPQTALIDGDARSVSIAAASIIAKVSRDRFMRDTAERDFPGYGFAQHKGYGVAAHQAALDRLGPCPLHRRTFAPVRRVIQARRAQSAPEVSVGH